MDKVVMTRLAAVAASAVLLTACGDEESSGSGLPSAGSAAGAYTINAAGADADALGGGTGGLGGSLTVTLNEGMEGGIEILDNGKADASFSAKSVSENLGLNAATIASDATIAVVGVEPAAGTLYLVNGESNLYLSDGDGNISNAADIVTGLKVDTAATLTLGLNFGGSAVIDLSGDLVNNGTITTDVNGAAKGDLQIAAQNYTGSGTVTTAGTDATVVDGGLVDISADYIINNSGAITTSGFTDTAATPVNGGNAGSINLTAITGLYNSGALTAKGGAGDGTGNNGGSGANVALTSEMSGVYNSAAIDTSGGNANVVPGFSGAITLSTNMTGDVVNSGALTTKGGNSIANSGRSGSSIIMTASGGGIKNSGDLSTGGGSAAETFTGGNGGNVVIRTFRGSFETDPGHILVSGNIDVSGGAVTTGATGGSTGGDAGNITITGNSAASRGAKQLVALWGYTGINVDGGNAETGGDAGSVTVVTNTSRKTINFGDDIEWRSSGNVVNEVAISATGGDSNTTTVAGSAGGAGGNVSMDAVNATDVLGDPQTVKNTGTITTSAGANFQLAGGTVASGGISMSATGGVTNSGALTTTGGSDPDTTGVGRGNDGGAVSMVADIGTAKNTAAIITSGGDGLDRGGLGEDVTLFGAKVSNSGNVTTSGGNAGATTVGSLGGDAGTIAFVAKKSGSISDSGTHAQAGGTGETTGLDNTVFKYAGH